MVSSDLRGVPPPPQLIRTASAPRRWSPKALALALICVALGGLVVIIGVQSLTKRSTVLVVAHAVPVGSTLEASDLTTASITSDTALNPVPDGQRDAVIGKVALVDLRAGTTLTMSEIGADDGFTAGQILVALPLKPGQFPARGLAAGQSVIVVATPGANSANGGSTTSTAPGTSSSAGTRATVAEVGSTNLNTSVTVVDVRVDASAAAALAQLASTGNAAVLLLPPGR